MGYCQFAGEDLALRRQAEGPAHLHLDRTCSPGQRPLPLMDGTDMSRVVVIAACGLALAGCASGGSADWFPKYEPAKVNVQFQSDPPGAEAKTSSGEACQTPCAIAMAPDKDFSVTFLLTGYEPQTVQVAKDTNTLEASLHPNPVAVELAKAAPPSKRQPRKPAATTASAAKPAARPAAARPAARPAATAPAAAPAAAPPPPAAGDPWPAAR